MTTDTCALDAGWPVPEAPETPFFTQLLHNVEHLNLRSGATSFALYVQSFTAATDHRISNEYAKWRERHNAAGTALNLTYHREQFADDADLYVPPESYPDDDPHVTAKVNQFCEDSGPIDMTDLYRPMTIPERIGRRLRKIFHMRAVVYADVTDIRKRVKEPVV
jgi:hypothetical protein